ncbi:MAG TPA: 30S ribosomal protein S8 [Candidatus Nanoarchaeia archaeon]|nr:30S ribosomal protein S8P, small subunit ribosomal protein S8 [uncultured archaeon]HJX49966.1 30S ribosomal protein S8 [Candidatus Nanoarchaeia archaeon]
MSQDIVSDALNVMYNAKRARKESVYIKRISNLLVEILKIMKQEGAVKKYKINSKEKSIEITLGEFSKCRAVKPRFTVDATQIEKYRRRYLPARDIGIIIISTNKGLMTHIEAKEENTGGCLIAYFY